MDSKDAYYQVEMLLNTLHGAALSTAISTVENAINSSALVKFVEVQVDPDAREWLMQHLVRNYGFWVSYDSGTDLVKISWEHFEDVGSTGWQFTSVTPSTPSRALNSSAWQPHPTKPVWVSYAISISCALSPSSGEEGKVELLSDENSTPTTVRDTAENSNTGVLTTGLSLVQKNTHGLRYLVPAGHYVKLVSTNVTGTPAFAIVSQVEEVLG